MEAYVLFQRSNGWRDASREEQEEEDIGCPSDSEVSMLSSSDELNDDASSSASTDNFEMASLMSQLPLKRGLSKFFDGKSQSFDSLAAAGSLEDLAKTPRKRLRASRSCEARLQDAQRRRFSRPGCSNAGSAFNFKKVSRVRLSLLGAAPTSRLVLRLMTTARPAVLPGQPLLFA